ncbi:MAG TPA: AbrB/MazE/SpoVT family DNA-binding domain-containing protein [Magnetococcales bacterium]|nr:AbrB/MazE/SpoVT family DNA-binding domain-containing protein [Magnetococcales bacterium]
MRITSKGQITIPAHIREQAGLLPHTEVGFTFDGGDVRLVRVGLPEGGRRGRDLVGHLQSCRSKVTMTTDEIMALTRNHGA